MMDLTDRHDNVALPRRLDVSQRMHECRLTTKLSDGEMTYQHAGAPALVCALGSAARGRALYANRRSLQRLVRRRRLSQARAFNPMSNTHCPGRLLFEQRAYDARTGALDDAA